MNTLASRCAVVVCLLVGLFCSVPRASEVLMIIDDRSRSDLMATAGTPWRGFSDRVMGGISRETVAADQIEGRPCVRLTGEVRLENNGGFIQMALDLSSRGELDASTYTGLRLLVLGNGETYNVHLRTADTKLPWQSYRASFTATEHWCEVRLPFSEFHPYRLSAPLDSSRLQRLGLVAIGRAFHADLCVAEVALF
jgi:hypothetical protein